MKTRRAIAFIRNCGKTIFPIRQPRTTLVRGPRLCIGHASVGHAASGPDSPWMLSVSSSVYLFIYNYFSILCFLKGVSRTACPCRRPSVPGVALAERVPVHAKRSGAHRRFARWAREGTGPDKCTKNGRYDKKMGGPGVRPEPPHGAFVSPSVFRWHATADAARGGARVIRGTLFRGDVCLGNQRRDRHPFGLGVGRRGRARLLYQLHANQRREGSPPVSKAMAANGKTSLKRHAFPGRDGRPGYPGTVSGPTGARCGTIRQGEQKKMKNAVAVRIGRAFAIENYFVNR